MDSDSLNRSLEGLRKRIDDWLLRGSTEGSRTRKKLIGKFIKLVLYPFIIGVIVFSIAISKLGVELGVQTQTPQELLGTAGKSAGTVDVEVELGDRLDLSSIELPDEIIESSNEPASSAPQITAQPEVVELESTPALTEVDSISAPVEAKELESANDVLEKQAESEGSLEQVEELEPTIVPTESDVEEPKVEVEPVEDTVIVEKSSDQAVSEVSEIPDVLPSKIIFPVEFAIGSAVVSSSSEEVARNQEVLNWLVKCTGVISLVGHSDSLGLEETNFSLGLARAEAVRNILLSNSDLNGLTAARLNLTSRGSLEPVGDNTTERGRAANRRVELSCVKE